MSELLYVPASQDILDYFNKSTQQLKNLLVAEKNSTIDEIQVTSADFSIIKGEHGWADDVLLQFSFNILKKDKTVHQYEMDVFYTDDFKKDNADFMLEAENSFYFYNAEDGLQFYSSEIKEDSGFVELRKTLIKIDFFHFLVCKKHESDIFERWYEMYKNEKVKSYTAMYFPYLEGIKEIEYETEASLLGKLQNDFPVSINIDSIEKSMRLFNKN